MSIQVNFSGVSDKDLGLLLSACYEPCEFLCKLTGCWSCPAGCAKTNIQFYNNYYKIRDVCTTHSLRRLSKRKLSDLIHAEIDKRPTPEWIKKTQKET